jgi:Virulence factor Evf
MQQDKLLEAEAYFGVRSDADAAFARSEPTKATTKGPDSVCTYILATEKIPESAQEEFLILDQYLKDINGMITAKVQSMVAKKGDPKEFWNPALWMEVLTRMPMLSGVKLPSRTEKKTVVGLEIATKFVQMLTGIAVAGPSAIPTQFVSYLQSLQEDIKITGESTTKGFKFGCIAMRIQSQNVGGMTLLEGYLVPSFITFVDTRQIVRSNCIKVSKFDFDMQIYSGSILFNHTKLTPGSDVKAKFDKLIGRSEIASIEEAESYFGFEGEAEELT